MNVMLSVFASGAALITCFLRDRTHMHTADYARQMENATSYQDVVDTCEQYWTAQIAHGKSPPDTFGRPMLFRFMVEDADPVALKSAREQVHKIIDQWGIEAVIGVMTIGGRVGLQVCTPRWLTAEEDKQLPAVMLGFPIAVSAFTSFDSFRRQPRPSDPALKP
jgi:hypothetical protein